MRIPPALSTLLFGLMLSSMGCSSLGLSFHTGSPLTKQTTAVLDQSPAVAAIPKELSQGVLEDHYLEPGDALLIEAIDFDSGIRLPADQRVMADGRIDLGRYGRLLVAGQTLESTEQMIAATIANQEADIDVEGAKVNVRLLEPVHRFYVLGEVNSPGSYPLVGHETVLDGILAGGGLTSAANPCQILLARPTLPQSCRVTLPVCYRQITQLGDTSTNYQLQPGDRIYVASRSWCAELKFWEGSHTCERCRGCQSACCEPGVASYSNPFAMAASGPKVSLPISPTSDPAAGPPAVAPAVMEIPSSPESTGAPLRLPAPLDGELDFKASPGSPNGPDSTRFEPLWITPPDLDS